MSQWVRGRGSRSQRVRASRAQPAGGGREPTARQAKTPTPSRTPGIRALSSPHAIDTPARTPSPYPDPLWDTPRDTQRHTGLWPVTLALRRLHTASQMHIRTPSGRTHIPSLAHTLSWSHTHSSGEKTQEHTHTQAQLALDTHSHSPPTHTHHVRAHKLPGGHTLLPRPPHTAKNYLQIPGSAPLERAGSWHFLGALAENPVCPGCLGR